MFLRLLFLLTFIPFVEIYFLIRMSDRIGFGNTVLVVLATGVLGAWLLRKQGHSILMEIQKNSAQNQIPSDALAKGFFTFIGGLLLLTPGVLTDFFGLSLIFPPTQLFWKRYFTKQFTEGVQRGNIHVYSSHMEHGAPFQQPYSQQSRPHSIDSDVIDVDAQAETVDKKD